MVLREKGVLFQFSHADCVKANVWKPSIFRDAAFGEIFECVNTSLGGKSQKLIIIGPYLISTMAIVRYRELASFGKIHLCFMVSKRTCRIIALRTKLTLQIDFAGYGSLRPFRKAAELSSTRPPYSITKSRFFETLCRTASHRKQSAFGSSLFSRMRSKWPTMGGFKACSISNCRSK